MKILKIAAILAVLIQCTSKEGPKRERNFPGSELGIPIPKFTVPIDRVEEDIRTLYSAEAVLIDRPVDKTAPNEYEYWLRIELKNVQLENTTMKIYSTGVASKIVSYLENPDDFAHIEVSVKETKGNIVHILRRRVFLYH